MQTYRQYSECTGKNKASSTQPDTNEKAGTGSVALPPISSTRWNECAIIGRGCGDVDLDGPMSYEHNFPVKRTNKWTGLKHISPIQAPESRHLQDIGGALQPLRYRQLAEARLGLACAVLARWGSGGIQ
nr:uncharacterized protein CTRU02_06981 [Colletotrichum truncatum]KAF6791797.1 hypothetical protein CTRU02_06981 [Colletotrichum truncatum]